MESELALGAVFEKIKAGNTVGKTFPLFKKKKKTVSRSHVLRQTYLHIPRCAC